MTYLPKRGARGASPLPVVQRSFSLSDGQTADPKQTKQTEKQTSERERTSWEKNGLPPAAPARAPQHRPTPLVGPTASTAIQTRPSAPLAIPLEPTPPACIPSRLRLTPPSSPPRIVWPVPPSQPRPAEEDRGARGQRKIAWLPVVAARSMKEWMFRKEI